MIHGSRNTRVSRRFAFASILAAACFLNMSFMAPGAHAYVSPGKPAGFVNDFAHVLRDSDRQAMEDRLRSLEQTTGDEVAVVTVASIGTDETIESYAVKLFEEWGIGSKQHDNGLLILVAVDDRQARIEVGYGLEGTVTDIQSGNIIRTIMIPAFKEGNYEAGISGAVNAVASIITGSADAAQYSSDAPAAGESSRAHINFGAIFFIGFIVLNALARILGSSKSWWLGGVLGALAGIVLGLFFGFVIGAISIIILAILGLIFDFIVSNRPPGSGGSGFWPIFLGGGRGGFGGGSGGGFGGFGGGMSGGGGASGRW